MGASVQYHAIVAGYSEVTPTIYIFDGVTKQTSNQTLRLQERTVIWVHSQQKLTFSTVTLSQLFHLCFFCLPF